MKKALSSKKETVTPKTVTLAIHTQATVKKPSSFSTKGTSLVLNSPPPVSAAVSPKYLYFSQKLQQTTPHHINLSIINESAYNTPGNLSERNRTKKESKTKVWGKNLAVLLQKKLIKPSMYPKPLGTGKEEQKHIIALKSTDSCKELPVYSKGLPKIRAKFPLILYSNYVKQKRQVDLTTNTAKEDSLPILSVSNIIKNPKPIKIKKNRL